MQPFRTDFDFTQPALREISLRVAAVNGINLGQGVCQTPPPPEVLEAAKKAVSDGHNRYAPAQGIAELREALAKKFVEFNCLPITADNIIVTAGATGAYESVVQTLLEPGDEVILFRPFYPYHRNATLRARGVIRTCPLYFPDWSFSRDEFLKCFTPKTKLVVITTPNNPTGKVFSREDLEWIGQTCTERGVWCVADEVYEYLTYDGREHVSIGSLPGLADSVITMGSYSKTFSVTGWRVGYIVAPMSLVNQLRTVSDQLYVCAPTPLQHATLRALTELPQSYYDDMRRTYHTKRAFMADALTKAGFEFQSPEGAYYILTSTHHNFPGKSAGEVLDLMIAKCGIGAVPTVDFVGPEIVADKSCDHLLRFCFSVPDEVLREVDKRLGLLKK
jgi:aminotransferase